MRKKAGLHDWQKVKRHNDHVEYVCNGCGIVSKQFLNEPKFIYMSKKYNRAKAQCCEKPKKWEAPKRIKIVNLDIPRNPVHFRNITIGSIHNVVDPPSTHTNDPSGVFVMGYMNATKIKIWTEEYEPVKSRLSRGPAKNKFKRGVSRFKRG